MKCEVLRIIERFETRFHFVFFSVCLIKKNKNQESLMLPPTMPTQAQGR